MQIAAIFFAVTVVMFAIELAAPRRRWRPVAGWWARAVPFSLVQVASVYGAGVTWESWFQGRGLFDLESVLGTAGAGAVGYLVVTFIYYWWHRARHELPILWRLFHQLHHSPQRIEIVTTFYRHPVEIFANSVLPSAILYLVLGLGPETAALIVVLTGLGELIFHWNIRTPYWLGFIFQRPESHCVHHQTGWHTQNFSDLPLWDMLFGTFHNPRRFDADCGFAEDRERRLGDMLMAVDVNRPAAGEPAAGR